MINIGDCVQLKQVPPDIEAMPDESDEMGTKNVFRLCVGRVFHVRGIGTNSPHQDTGHVELWVQAGDDCHDVAAANTIWVEPEYLERMTNKEEEL